MVDIEELKKLPAEEKWKIIDELEASMEEEYGEFPNTNYEENLNQLLADRLAAYHRGETKSYTWEEVQNRLETVREKMNATQDA